MSTVLDSAIHARLLQNADELCATAGIPRWMLDKSASEFCGTTEVDYLTKFRSYRASGKAFAFCGKFNHPSVDIRMMAMCAAFLRNFIDARVVPLNTLLEPDAPNPTVLLVPNFFVGVHGKTLPGWKLQMLYDLLLQRFVSGKPVILYIEHFKEMEKEYGSLMASHIRSHALIDQGD